MDPSETRLLEHLERAMPHFDSRVFNVPTNAELVNNVMWRASWDFRRNSISTLAQAHFSPKQLHGKNTKQQLEMMAEKGISWDDQPDWYKWGVFAKREKFIKEVEVKGAIVKAVRSRIAARSFELTRKFTKELEELIVDKHWPEAKGLGEETEEADS